MAVSEQNRLRYRALKVHENLVAMFCAVPGFLRDPRRWLVGWILRAMFLGPDDKPHRAGEIVLAELRREAGLNKTTNFHLDPHMHAYREGQRSIAMWIFYHLNLDENDVQQLMELDDGL